MTETKSSVTRVLLIDDHALFRESVAKVLAMDPELEIAHCASIAAALQLIAQHRFDLVLLDHDLTQMTIQCETLLFMASRAQLVREIIHVASDDLNECRPNR